MTIQPDGEYAGMPSFFSTHRHAYTFQDPLDVFVTSLRHYGRAEVAQNILNKSFGIELKEAGKVAQLTSAFAQQAMEFYDCKRTAPIAIRPVLQYYCYLNLATAVVISLRPRGWDKYRRHGVSDITGDLSSVAVDTPLVKVSEGVVPLFHSLISDWTLRDKRFSIQELATAIPQVSFELTHYYNVNQVNVGVSLERIYASQAKPNEVHSEIQFSSDATSGWPKEQVEQIQARLETAMPQLVSLYDLVGKTDNRLHLKYKSKRAWSTSAEAEAFHSDVMTKIGNIGGHGVQLLGGSSVGLLYSWHVSRDFPVLPTLSATLLLSFALASISRYRANLLHSIQRSELYMLLEVFMAEADHFFVPALRNMLHREFVVLGRMQGQ